MEILLIIMLAPVALALGVGIIRLMFEPAFWFALMGFSIAGVLAIVHG
jgi:hypothetical protein